MQASPRKTSTASSSSSPAGPPDHPVNRYALAVVRGEILTGKWVRLACERHLQDLATGHERGLWFDYGAADRIVNFFGFLRHSKGEWAGKPLVLEPWQVFILGAIFGWKRADGTRRYRNAYVELARKNGKSTIGAGVGLYLAFFDGEAGAEVYSAATKRDQAKIVWGEARRMVLRSPDLRKRISTYINNLSWEATASKFEPLGADEDSLDGLNIHGTIIDELHAHKTRKLWDVLDTATGSRRQPLNFVITTAGIGDRTTIYWEQHHYALQVLEGVVQDDGLFVYPASIDEGDDWTDPACWIKANPNLGISVKLDYLQEQCARARQIPGRQNAFRRLHLGVLTEQSERWIDIALWDEGGQPVDPEELRGRRCYGGLDLARVRDLSALVLAFPPEDEGERWKLLAWYWLPEDNLHERVDRDRVPYDVWVDQESIETTPGNTTDFRFVAATIVELAGIYDLRELAYDRTFAGELVNTLTEEGITMVQFGQGFLSMAAPCSEFERLVQAKQLQHGGHPVLRWNVANTTVAQDPAGNLKPDKRKSTERIDGTVAAIMAVGRAAVNSGEGASVYESRGPMTLDELLAEDDEDQDETEGEEDGAGPE